VAQSLDVDVDEIAGAVGVDAADHSAGRSIHPRRHVATPHRRALDRPWEVGMPRMPAMRAGPSLWRRRSCSIWRSTAHGVW